MKYITCFFLANIIYLTAFYGFACDPTLQCKSKATDTTAKKPAVKIGTIPAQPSTKPIAKKMKKRIQVILLHLFPGALLFITDQHPIPFQKCFSSLFKRSITHEKSNFYRRYIF